MVFQGEVKHAEKITVRCIGNANAGLGRGIRDMSFVLPNKRHSEIPLPW